MDLQPLPRTDLTQDERQRAVAVALKIAGLLDRGKRLAYVTALVVDNISLQKEANTHRAVLGYEPIKTYPIDANKVG